MDKQKYWFFGSKLNTLLLAILIILMIVALKWMHENKAVYMPVVSNSVPAIHQEPQIEGNKEDLIFFSIKPGQEVSGKMTVTGLLKGAYFFEGNLPIAILDANKNPTSYGPGHANSTTDWMTAGPVSFSTIFDFSVIPKGSFYIRITKDDPRDASERGNTPIKQILIPIVIK